MNEQEVQVVLELSRIACKYAELLTGVSSLLLEVRLYELNLALFFEKA